VTVAADPRPAQETVVSVTDLDAGYLGVKVLSKVSLHSEAGEVVALLGANGSGKSTTLKTIGGELPPLSGRVEVLGNSRLLPLHRRVKLGLGYVTEERSISARLTVRQNIAISSCSPSAATALFPELDELMGRQAGLLSGGEQQMLSLARVLGRDSTKLLLADELSLGLAPRSVGRLLRATRDAADRGLGVLVVEQHVHRVLDIADRVYVLERGRIVYQAPANRARAEIDEIRSHYLGETAQTNSHDTGAPVRSVD
jgi:branched-chain amino acid transport system ATP-binding protein